MRIYSYFLVFMQYSVMTILFIINRGAFFKMLPLIIFLVGFFIGIYALYHNKPGNFNISPDIKEGASLVRSGIYRYIRHPMYLSVAVMMLGMVSYDVSITNIILYVLLIASIYLKAAKEEKLWCDKSEEYKIYRQKTKAFIPFIL